MLRIEDYYTDAPSAGIITLLEKPEIVNRLMNTFYINFKGYDYTKMRLEIYPVREELEEYKNLSTDILNQIQKVRVYYDGHQLALKRVLKDINHDTHLNTKVYSPVIGCAIDCPYCFSKGVIKHFEVTENSKKPVFRGFYKIFKDAEGNDVPELFNIESDDPIDWFLTYMSDFGCWRPEWQENVIGQIIAANNLKRKKNKCLDTFQLVTKRPSGIDLSTIPMETDLQNVVISCTVDKNEHTHRIPELISKTRGYHITACVVYQPVLEYIEPSYLDELVKAFGVNNTWVVVGSLIGEQEEPFQFAWIKDIIDKCIELDIPLKMEYDIKAIVEANGYDFLMQEPKPMRDTKAIRMRNLAKNTAIVSEHYDAKVAELRAKLEKSPVSDRISIALFTMFGDVEIIVESAKRLLERVPEFDIIITAESKGIHLAYEMAKQTDKSYIVAHKSVKPYMKDLMEVPVKSITPTKEQKLYLDIEDVEALKGKRVLIVEDVISTGKYLKALSTIVEKSGGIAAAKVAILADAEAAKLDDYIYLELIEDFSNGI